MSAPRTLEVLRGVLAGAGEAPASDSGTDSCFRQLLYGIVALEFEPGQMVSERELMGRTGAARATLRFAVGRLSDLGLITPHARKGLIIAPLDVLDVSALYDARLAIESAVARFAAQRATVEQIERLRNLLAESQSATEEADAISFVARDMALHMALAAAGRNPYLENALTRILPQGARLWHRLYREFGTDRKFMFEHADVVSAVASRDADGAEAAMVEHLQSAREILAGAFIPVGRAEAL